MSEPLLALLRLGLGNSTPEHENLSDFIMMPAERWAMIGRKAADQGVLGIMLDGVECLDATPYGPTRELPKQQKLEWIGQVIQIEQGNRHQIKVMNDLVQKWTKEGCRVMVMKGQANSLMYPYPEHRSPGDIDCYLFENFTKGNVIAKNVGASVDEGWYKHSQIAYKGETFENHQYFVHTREGKRSKQLQKKLESALQIKEWHKFPQSEILLPPAQWNAMFLTYHACAHFLSEGLRLKQVLDWAMFLKTEQHNVDWKAFYVFCERYHFRKFADAMTAISVGSLGVTIENADITTESPYSERILSSILNDDDYIYSENEGGWKERWHVIKNLFHYRWKYEEIYEQGVWKQLRWYASGYLLQTGK